MLLDNVTRKQAFYTHLAVSSGIFIIIAYLIVFHWYPDFYFSLDGGLRGITTIFFVDIVLGPGLTLLVFKPGKKSLRFDMTVILLFQLVALSWGVHSVYSERSGSAVFYWGKISCVSHNDTKPMNMTAIESGISGRQRLSFLPAPDTIDEFHDFAKGAFINNSSEIYYYPEKILPMDEPVLSKLSRYELDMEELRNENTSHSDGVEGYIKQHPGNNTDYKLIPVACRYKKAIAVYDMQALKIKELIDVATSVRAADNKDFVAKNVTVERAGEE